VYHLVQKKGWNLTGGGLACTSSYRRRAGLYLEDAWPVPEECGPHLGDEDGVDAAQLGIDLEAEVGEHLRRRPRHVLGLDALGGDAQHAVPHPLHLKNRFLFLTRGSR
jgi:hypothetical protein